VSFNNSWGASLLSIVSGVTDEILVVHSLDWFPQICGQCDVNLAVKDENV
jgi:hypothetical protein